MAAIEDTIRVGHFIFESATDSLTAAGSNQATAFALAIAPNVGTEINRFSTVAASTGCLLPPSQPGMTIMVINAGANNLTVYGTGGDTIDGNVNTTGVLQMPNSGAIYVCSTAGAWYTVGLNAGWANATSVPTQSFANALTATGSNQATALAITAQLTEFGTVGSNTGTILPVSQGGMEMTVINNGANTLSVYPAGTEKINALATSASFAMSSPPTVTIFFCTAAGQWWTK
jgi:hypothetical protein